MIPNPNALPWTEHKILVILEAFGPFDHCSLCDLVRAMSYFAPGGREAFQGNVDLLIGKACGVLVGADMVKKGPTNTYSIRLKGLRAIGKQPFEPDGTS